MMKSPSSRRTAASRFAALTLSVAFAMLPTAVFAQGSGGTLTGRATDEQNAALPGVTITAADPSTGTSRVVVTDADGSYRFPSLYAGNYDVTAELDGFATGKAQGVTINVATVRTLDFQLKVAGVEEIITVNDVAPLVRTEASGGVVVSRETLESLPLNGRQFANLGTLAPGTTLGINPDPTKPGQLVIAMNGGIGRNVNYVIDGGDNMDDTIGGALQNFSVEAVQEFNLQTQQYKAEYGRSSGGVLTVVTKSGTNEWEGAAYGYVRDDQLNAKKESEKQAGVDKQPYRREQYGGSIGGPIVHDKAHFFANYEETTRCGFVVTDTGGIFGNLDGQPDRHPVHRQADLRQGDRQPVGQELRAGAVRLPEERRQIQRRHQRHPGQLRHPGQNEAFSVLAGLQSQVGDSSFNELNVQYAEFENSITADSTNPTLNFPSGVTSGQNPNTPQTTLQEKRQIRDDFSFSKVIGGRTHDFKVGLEYIDEPVLGGDFLRRRHHLRLCRRQPQRPDHRHHHQRGRLLVLDPQHPVAFLRPGRLAGQRQLHPEPGLPLRRLGHPRARPAHQRDLAGALHPDHLQRGIPPGVPGRQGRRDREGRRRLFDPPRLHLGHQGRRPAAAARRHRPLLRLSVHQRHRALPDRRRGFGGRQRLPAQQPERHPQRRRLLLPSRPAAASEPAAEPERGPGAARTSPRRPSRPRTPTRSRSAIPTS